MIKLTLSDIISKIKSISGLSEKEINDRIEQKLAHLSGLISREGAAHIIANELGIKLFEAASGKLQIKNILVGMRNVEAAGEVQQVFPLSEFQRKDGTGGKVCSFVVGDETGTIRVVGWGGKADEAAALGKGAIIKIVGGYVRENKGQKEVHLNDRSQLIVNPEGEKIGKVKYESKPAAARKPIKDLAENDLNVEILGTIVQAFEPKFFEVCPQCGRRARLKEGSFVCDSHGKVAPDSAYVMNVFLDDGTDNIRAVFFRRQLEALLGMAPQEIILFKDKPEDFEAVKSKLLGEQIRLIGKVNKNEMFDRLEFVAQLVDVHPDPGKEIEQAEKEKPVRSSEDEMTEEEYVTGEVEKIN